jgi:uncharacterized protein YbjT (DUF2867 family)
MATYLILGGTGKTGRRLAAQLTAAGHTARTAARTPGPPAPGVEPVRFDWDDRSTWGPALEGVEAVYLVPPALRLDHAPLLGALAEQARAAGVARGALLSARGVDQGPADGPLLLAEQAVAASGLPSAVVRPSWFMQNFTESFFAPAIRAEGVVVAPTGDGAVAFVDAEDIAAVAAAALTGAAPAAAYDVSGPRALTFAEVAQVLGGATGLAVRHVDLPVEAWRAGAEQNGLPPAYAQLLGGLFDVIRGGGEAHVSPGVPEATGRAATPFEDWAAREAGALVAAEPARSA